jgi:hypothetical protein
MTKQMILDQDYIDSYSRDFSQIICDNHFDKQKYISGQEIIELTPSSQLNLLVIRELFEDWQQQIDLLAKSPYFDYNDKAVKAALSSFMNVLSRAIRIEKQDFEPLLKKAVEKTIYLATDPVDFIEQILNKASGNPGSYSKGLKKYIKWYSEAWIPGVEEWANDSGSMFWKQKLYEGFEQEGKNLEQPASLLEPLQKILPLEFESLVKDLSFESNINEDGAVLEAVKEQPKHYIEEVEEVSTKNQETGAAEDQEIETIDPAIVWAKFDTGENPYMKGSISHLKEGMGINQRIMFTKRLFQGNPDLMDQAIIELDATESFYEAIDLLNQSFVKSLDWDIHSEEVLELLQLIFRKFDAA